MPSKHLTCLGLAGVAVLALIFIYNGIHGSTLFDVENERSERVLREAADYSRCDQSHYWQQSSSYNPDKGNCLPCTFCTDDEIVYESGLHIPECIAKNRGCPLGQPYFCMARKYPPTPSNQTSKYCDVGGGQTSTVQSIATTRQEHTTIRTTTKEVQTSTQHRPIEDSTTSQTSTSSEVTHQPPTRLRLHVMGKAFIAAAVILVVISVCLGFQRWRVKKITQNQYSAIQSNGTQVTDELPFSEDLEAGEGSFTRNFTVEGDGTQMSANNDDTIDGATSPDTPGQSSLDSGIGISMVANDGQSKEAEKIALHNRSVAKKRLSTDSGEFNTTDEDDCSLDNLDPSSSNTTKYLDSDLGKQVAENTYNIEQNKEEIKKIGDKCSQLFKYFNLDILDNIGQSLTCFSVNQQVKILICSKASFFSSSPCTIIITCIETDTLTLNVTLETTPMGYSTVKLNAGYTYQILIHIHQTDKGMVELTDTVYVDAHSCKMTLWEFQNHGGFTGEERNMLMQCEPDVIFMRMLADILGVGKGYLDWISCYKDPNSCNPMNKIIEEGCEEPVGVLFHCLFAREKYDVIWKMCSAHHCLCCDQVYRRVKEGKCKKKSCVYST